MCPNHLRSWFVSSCTIEKDAYKAGNHQPHHKSNEPHKHPSCFFEKYGFELSIRYGAAQCGIELTPPSRPPWATTLPFSSITATLRLLAVVELSLTEPPQSFCHGNRPLSDFVHVVPNADSGILRTPVKHLLKYPDFFFSPFFHYH